MVQPGGEPQGLLKEGLGLAERMSRIALAMQALLDIEGSAEARERMDLGALVQEIAGELQLAAEAAEVRLECHCGPDSETMARPEQLRRACFHTLNAILRRAARGGVVKVDVESAKARATLCFRWPASGQPMPGRRDIIAENPAESFPSESFPSESLAGGNIEDNLDCTLARAVFEGEHASWQVADHGDETILTVIFENGIEHRQLQKNESQNNESPNPRSFAFGGQPDQKRERKSMMPAYDFAAGSVLIASADGVLQQSVLARIEGRCAKVERAAGGAAALARLEQGDWRFLFLDRQLPDLNAEEVRGMVALRFPQVEVVMIDSGSSEPDADSDISPEQCRDQGSAGTEAQGRPAGRHDAPLPSMIGDSPPMRELYRKARLVAPRLTTVLISGPTGCGKELVARALHDLSPRSRKPFVVVNCAAIPDSLVESELFGHVRGAFTGAVQSQAGRIPAAHGGTLFLDEVGDLSPAAQAKLLRFLELREVQRLGGSEVFTVDVRVVAASHRDLTECAGTGEFREDLYYRLAVFPLAVPALAERRDDIVRLAEHVLQSVSAAARLVTPRLSPQARQMLLSHSWRGNVRELQHVMERASILSEGKLLLDAEHITFASSPSPGARRVRAAA